MTADSPAGAVPAVAPRDAEVGTEPGPALASLRRGGLVLAMAQVGAMALGVASGMLLVRIAAPHEVASYLLFSRAVAAVAVVLQLGLVPAVTRFAPLSRGAGGDRSMAVLRRRVLGLQAAVWALATPAVLFGWPHVVERLGAPELTGVALIALIAAVAVSYIAVGDAHLRAARRYFTSATLSLLAVRVLLAGCLLALLATGLRPGWRPLVELFAGLQLVGAIAVAVATRRTRALDTVGTRTAQPPPSTRALLSTVAVMGLHSTLAALLVSWDLWLVAWARSHEEVAVYGVMLTVVQAISFVPAVVNRVIPQEFSVLHVEGRRAELEALVRGSATAVGVISVLLLLVLLLLGRPLIAFAFSPSYAAGWLVLLVLAVGRCFDALCGSAGFLLQMTGHHRVLLAITATGAAANLGLAALLAPRFGGLGVALATTATLIGLNLVMVWQAQRRVGVRSFAYLRPAQWLAVGRRMAGRRLG